MEVSEPTIFNIKKKFYSVVSGNAMQVAVVNPKPGDDVPVIFHIAPDIIESYKLVFQDAHGAVTQTFLFEDINPKKAISSGKVGKGKKSKDEKEDGKEKEKDGKKPKLREKTIKFNSAKPETYPRAAVLTLIQRKEKVRANCVKELVKEGTYRISLVSPRANTKEVFITLNVSFDDTLPSSWAPNPSCLRIVDLQNKNTVVNFVGTTERAAVLRSNIPIPPQTPFYFFQFTITNVGSSEYGEEGKIVMGLVPKNHNLKTLPGLDQLSVGYHGHTGFVYHSYNTTAKEAKPYSTIWKNGDVIGCAWDRITGRIYFAKNGFTWNTAWYNYHEECYVAIGIGAFKASVITNFKAMETENITNMQQFLAKYPVFNQPIQNGLYTGLWCGWFFETEKMNKDDSVEVRMVLDSKLDRNGKPKYFGFGDQSDWNVWEIDGSLPDFKGYMLPDEAKKPGIDFLSATWSKDRKTITGRWRFDTEDDDDEEEEEEKKKAEKKVEKKDEKKDKGKADDLDLDVDFNVDNIELDLDNLDLDLNIPDLDLDLKLDDKKPAKKLKGLPFRLKFVPTCSSGTILDDEDEDEEDDSDDDAEDEESTDEEAEK